MKNFLSDVNNEIRNKFTPKRLKSLRLAESYYRLHMLSQSQTVSTCAETVEYRKFKSFEKAKLYKVWFCKNRLCSVCAWRRSLKIYNQLSKVMNEIELMNYRFIFVTLTVKNCVADELKSTINQLTKAFNLFKQYKELRFVQGFFRALEVTHDNRKLITNVMYFGSKKYHMKSKKRYYNRLGLRVGDKNPNFDTYHPHLHCVLAVRNDYFDDKSQYLTQDRLCQLWKRALNVNYKPVCDIRTVRPSQDKDKQKGTVSYSAAVAEVGKYTLKDTDYLSADDLQQTDKTVKTLTEALHRVRLVAWGGIFNDIRKQLKIDDAVDGDLLHVSDQNDIRDDLSYIVIKYSWNFGANSYDRTIERHVNIMIEREE